MSLRLKLVLLVTSLTIVLLGGLGLNLGGSMRAWTTEVVDEELSRTPLASILSQAEVALLRETRRVSPMGCWR